MIFRDSSPTADTGSTTEYGSLLKRLLGATTIPEQEVSDDITARMISETESSAINRLSSETELGKLAEGYIKIGSRIAGHVAQVGPACLDVNYKSFKKMKFEWKWFVDKTQQANYTLLPRLAHFENHHMNNIQRFQTHLYWAPSKLPASVVDCQRQLVNDISLIYSTPFETASENPHIFFMSKFVPDEEELPISGFIGLAPPGTKEGDLICQFREPGILNHRALVVRKHAILYQIIGIAVMSDSVKMVKQKEDGEAELVSLSDQTQYGLGTALEDRYLDIHFDAARTFQLLD